LQISAFAARVGSRNSGMQTELTKEIIERAFDEMGNRPSRKKTSPSPAGFFVLDYFAR
jgi:hypothetical protein